MPLAREDQANNWLHNLDLAARRPARKFQQCFDGLQCVYLGQRHTDSEGRVFVETVTKYLKIENSIIEKTTNYNNFSFD